MIKLYNLDFCKLEIHSDYMLATMHEGIVVSDKNNATLINIAKKHYNTPFVYITHRVHSYSVDPIVYIRTGNVPNLIGFAVVSDNPLQKKHTKYEKTFFNKEFKQFDDMESALRWKDEILKKHQDEITQQNDK